MAIRPRRVLTKLLDRRKMCRASPWCLSSGKWNRALAGMRGVGEPSPGILRRGCHHLFQENAEALFGNFPEGKFEYRKCKLCRTPES